MFNPSPRKWRKRRVAASAAALVVGASIFSGVTSWQNANAAEGNDPVETAPQCLTLDADPQNYVKDKNTPPNEFLARSCWLNNTLEETYGGPLPSEKRQEDLVGTLNAGNQQVMCQMRSVYYKGNPWWALAEVDVPRAGNRHHDMTWASVTEFAQHKRSGRAADQPLRGVPDCDKSNKAEWTTINLDGVDPSLNVRVPGAAQPAVTPVANVTKTPASDCPKLDVTAQPEKVLRGTTNPNQWVCNVAVADAPVRYLKTSAGSSQMIQFGQLTRPAGAELVVACQYNFGIKEAPQLVQSWNGRQSGWYVATRADKRTNGKTAADNVSLKDADMAWGWVSVIDLQQNVDNQPLKDVRGCPPSYALKSQA